MTEKNILKWNEILCGKDKVRGVETIEFSAGEIKEKIF